MRIGIMAAGAVGGYFGARLAAAGHEVHFIARGAQLAALRHNGLTIESPLGDLHLKDIHATDDPAAVGPVDVVLFAVKLWDTEQAAQLTRPMLDRGARLITVQNGIDSVERIAPILGADRVLGGTAHIACAVVEPGVIRHTSRFARLRAGRSDGKPDAVLERFVHAGQNAGIDIAAAEDITVERWKKFVFLAALAGATGATRQPLGAVLADPDTRTLFITLMREVMALAAARGVVLPPDFLDAQIKFAENAPKSMKASLLHDLERGNRLELDWLTGAVCRLGRELNLPTPTSDAVYAVLKLHRMGARVYGE
jgi:2-dehydropantoate 2-reductase